MKPLPARLSSAARRALATATAVGLLGSCAAESSVATGAVDGTVGTDGSDSADNTDDTDAATDSTDGAPDTTDGSTDATDGGTDGTTDGSTDAIDATDGGTDANDGTGCGDCDDGDPCTTDQCGAGGQCTHKAGGGPECVPTLEIASPSRGETRIGEEAFEVEGTAQDASGGPALLTINGNAIPVNADGSFLAALYPSHGINTLEAVASTEGGYNTARIQSVLVGDTFYPTHQGRGPGTIIGDGIQAWLGKDFWDDGDRGDLDDFAAITAAILEDTDFLAFLPPTIKGEGEAGGALWCEWTVNVTAIDFTMGDVDITPTPGGLSLSIALKDIVVAFEAIAPDLGCPDAIGTATIESVTVDTSLAIALAGTGAILVDVPELEVQITEPVLDITDGFAAFFDWAFNWFNGTFANVIETGIEAGVTGYVVPSIQEALEGFTSYTTTLTIPAFAGITKPVDVTLAADPTTFTLDYGGAFIGLGASVIAKQGIPDTIKVLGSLARQSCLGAGSAPFELPQDAPLALAISDDLLNQLLFGAFYGGLLHLDIPGSFIADKLGFDGLKVDTISLKPLLPPVITSCLTPGSITLQIGDFGVSVSLDVGGKSGTLDAFLFASADVTLKTVNGPDGVELGVSVDALDTFAFEVIDATGALDGSEAVIELLFKELASSLVKDAVGNGLLQSFPIPSFDISSFVSGLPSLSLGFNPQQIGSKNGYTLITGTVKGQ